jgi:hypothetical protein
MPSTLAPRRASPAAIAVAVVVETADSGSLTAVVAADIYDYYFSPKENDAAAQPYGELLV